jgi:hypothetical protein
MTPCSSSHPKALTPRLILVVTAILSLLWTASAPCWAAERRPLLMEGKSTLYQRILGSSFFCVHSLRLNKMECSTRICRDKQSLLAVPIFVGDETADGIPPIDPTALEFLVRPIFEDR